MTINIPKVLVTGGAGFIGHHLCELLLLKNYFVVVYDNLILGKKENLNQFIYNPNFRFIEADILDMEHLDKVFDEYKFDIVYHLAANSDIKKGADDPSIDKELTFQTTFNVLQCMKKYDVRKIFFSSTSAIYGNTNGLLNENYGPLMPVSNYGAGKLASEAYISAFSSIYNIKVWIARFPNVVGPGLTHGVIYDFINKLKKNPERLVVLGNGEQNKPYLYVKDLVDGIQFVIEHTHDRYNVYNLGSTTRTKVKDIALMVIEEMSLKATIEYTGGDCGWIGDVPEFKYDLTKINNLGWFPKLDSNESIRLAIKNNL